jgi:alanine racemase
VAGDAGTDRWAEAVIDLDALGHNLRHLRERVAPAAVWAVVKADAYGHGAVAVARRAVAEGAEGLCVALVAEGVQLRRAGLMVPVLVLSPQPPELIATALEASLTLTVHEVAQVEHLAAVARTLDLEDVPVHVKVDTGMHRVGATPHDAATVVRAVVEAAPVLRCDGVFTHFACADDPDHPLTRQQIATFDEVATALEPHLPVGTRRHLANSAAALAWPAAHADLVRAGIALYGIEPGAGVAHWCSALRPVLTLRSRVSMVKTVAAGQGVSYGWRSVLEHDTVVATVPLGYADGVPRRLALTGGEVLIGGRRRRLRGVITMDQFMVECGDTPVSVGDEVVLLGGQGDQVIRPEDWAERLGTIPYEIVCGISARVPRRWVGADH